MVQNVEYKGSLATSDLEVIPVKTPTFGIASCFATITQEHAEARGYEVLPTAIKRTEVLLGTPKQEEQLAGMGVSKQSMLEAAAILSEDALKKVRDRLLKDECCIERGVRVDLVWGRHSWWSRAR